MREPPASKLLRHHVSERRLAFVLLACMVCLNGFPARSIGAQGTEPIVSTVDAVMSLVPGVAIQGPGGRQTPFQRIVQVLMRSNGDLIVIDPVAPGVYAFHDDGRVYGQLGGQAGDTTLLGSPGYGTLITGDTLVLSDQSGHRLLFIDTTLNIKRVVFTPPDLVIRRLLFDSTSDRLLLSGFGLGEQNGVQVLGMDGQLLDRFVPITPRPELLGYSSSFQAGFIAKWVNGGFAYADEYPYRLRFYNANGTLRRTCQMQPDPTLDPARYVFRTATTMGVRDLGTWVHVAGLVLVPFLARPTYIVPVMTGATSNQYWDIITDDCRLVAHYQTPAPWYYPSGISDHTVAIISWGVTPSVQVTRVTFHPASPSPDSSHLSATRPVYHPSIRRP